MIAAIGEDLYEAAFIPEKWPEVLRRGDAAGSLPTTAGFSLNAFVATKHKLAIGSHPRTFQTSPAAAVGTTMVWASNAVRQGHDLTLKGAITPCHCAVQQQHAAVRC
ncbi:hypothetical protein BPNPMPFG_008422 (plasmid) [Mesorhizobium sp. AR07]|uniref:hypothetical protein n=1 Tax=Mesorhizobium sp. AR07 TaxID=2865838 RepID=UPI0021608D23|nr:hypothetical protein [Mesorhizobium sp. AR07]UVK49446.1 hypothetical protein BPNPMPFG_008422 [Mesorhizobium sp. AR07]